MYAGAGLLDAAGTCSAVLIRPAAGDPPADAPAYALTNGHCVDLFDATTVRRDSTVEPGSATISFGVRADGTPERQVAVTHVRWATMKGTDLAVVELAEPLADLLGAGLRAYPLADPPSPGTPVVVVGGPAPIDGGDRVLRLAACTAGASVDLFERHWTWFGFPANDCADIRPGSSGSPVLDPATGALVGLVNTTTQGSEGTSDCAMGRPCEVTAEGLASVPDAVYGPAVRLLAGCFDASWTFTGPGADCPLDPGDGIGAVSWTMTANPGATTITGDFPSPSTWAIALTGPPTGLTRMRLATGRPGALDCHDLAAYGPLVVVPEDGLYDPPLPTEGGSHLTCLIGVARDEPDAWAAAVRFPMVLRVDIDRIPPLVPVELSVRELPEGWMVEPVFQPPELSLFDWKWGPPDTTDCADPTDYTPYRRFPMTLERADAPIRLCVVGYDDANNATPPLDRVLGDP
ncbi:MAG: trypsin-like peptidase domain-containing protein [Chloroflexi bacterium]|nr:trypsin-like peptidase domain-containing protein [Chloroflexota bacterium]